MMKSFFNKSLDISSGRRFRTESDGDWLMVIQFHPESFEPNEYFNLCTQGGSVIFRDWKSRDEMRKWLVETGHVIFVSYT